MSRLPCNQTILQSMILLWEMKTFARVLEVSSLFCLHPGQYLFLIEAQLCENVIFSSLKQRINSP